MRATGIILFVAALLLPLTDTAWGTEPGAAAAVPEAADQLLSPAQLEQLVAPIALYPDDLLASVLMASTYPLEIVEAERWATKNKALKGTALTAALAKESWDDSVKSLVATPTVLAMMSEQLDWTQNLGDAVLAQQPDVMDAVQRLRLKAQANGHLKTTKEQTVTVQSEAASPVVVIAPVQPTVISVPYYDPAVVYGPWPYPGFAPYYFPPPPGYFAARAFAAGIAFGAGVAWFNRITGGFDWRRHDIDVRRQVNVNVHKNVNVNVNVQKWQHDPAHRGGVRYRNASVEKRYSKVTVGSVDSRAAFRGRTAAGDAGVQVKAGGLVSGAGGGAAAAGVKVQGKAGAIGSKAGGGVAAGGVKAEVKAKGRVSAAAGGAFSGIDKGGAAAKAASARGKASISSYHVQAGAAKAPRQPLPKLERHGGGARFRR